MYHLKLRLLPPCCPPVIISDGQWIEHYTFCCLRYAVKKIFIARHPTEAQLVKGLLELEGIESEVRGEALYGSLGGLAITEDTLPSVWIHDDSQIDQAMRIVSRYEHGFGSHVIIGKLWCCPKCGELLDPQFTSCWQCGTNRK